MSRSAPPLPDALVSEPVVLINAFTVPLEESERFLGRWNDNTRIMARRPGLVRVRMFRSLVDDVELRFVNVAEWGTPTCTSPRARSSTRPSSTSDPVCPAERGDHIRGEARGIAAGTVAAATRRATSSP
jgi:hypothetical protein